MTQLFSLAQPRILHTAFQYPTSNQQTLDMGLLGTRNEEMRAMTIAALRVAQNNTQLSQALMNVELLRFLMAQSASAIGHWRRKGWLSVDGILVHLTPLGLVEAQNTMIGEAGAYSTNEATVTEWVNRMLHGNHPCNQAQTFSPSHWPSGA